MTGGEKSWDGIKQPRYDGDLQGRTLLVEQIFPNIKSLCGEVHVFDLRREEKQGRDTMQISNVEPCCSSGGSANRAYTFHLKFNLVLLKKKLCRCETGIYVDSVTHITVRCAWTTHIFNTTARVLVYNCDTSAWLSASTSLRRLTGNRRNAATV